MIYYKYEISFDGIRFPENEDITNKCLNLNSSFSGTIASFVSVFDGVQRRFVGEICLVFV